MKWHCFSFFLFFPLFFLHSFTLSSGLLGPGLFLFYSELSSLYDLICLAFENIPAFRAQWNEDM